MTKEDVIIKLSILGFEVHILHKLFKMFEDNQDLRTILSPQDYIRFQAISLDDKIEEYKKHNIHILTIYDGAYPEKLKQIYRPPLVIYYQGNISLLKHPMIAVIGSRKYTSYGKKATEYLTKGLIENKMVIISGLAYGIDTIAHQYTISNKGKTISVIGSGLLNVYPKAHSEIAEQIAKDHLLISEYPPSEKPSKTHFVFRNRIISGLSDGVLVIEAKARSGTMITVDYALNQGKQIYAIPGSIFAENGCGTNDLIKQGAKPVMHVSDILEDFS